MNDLPKKVARSAEILQFTPCQYLVKVTSVVSQLHRITANSAEEAAHLAPEAEIVGETELIDILSSVPIQRTR